VTYTALYYDSLSELYQQNHVINHELSLHAQRKGYGVSQNDTKYKFLAEEKTFFAVYLLSLCTCIHAKQNSVKILVYTGKLNENNLAKYQSKIDHYHSQSIDLNSLFYNRNTRKKEIFNRKVQSIPNDFFEETVYRSSGQVTIQSEKVTFVADVIANSLLHHLEQYARSSDFSALNTGVATQTHPLYANMIACDYDILDSFFTHPKHLTS
jgi:hypothetical protein